MRIVTFAFATFALTLTSCSVTGSTCSASSDCGLGGVCLPAHACAKACVADAGVAACGASQTCTPSGGCVAPGGCGADSECGANKLCEALSCVAPCTETSCGNGKVCQIDGHCGTGAGTGPSCGGELFAASKVEANFLVVLDQSGSMNETLSSGTKWTTATSALKSVTEANEAQIRFGLSMFPGGAKCSAGQNFVGVGPSTASAIASAFPTKASGDSTPIAAALRLAGSRADLADTARANFVLLVTDGEENCGGKPVDEVTKLFAQGVRTYVVGFGRQVDQNALSKMAVEGGTARIGSTKFYQADDQASLAQAFNQIAQGAVGCDFKLAKAPPDLDKIYVAVGGKLVPRDASKRAGWEYSATTQRLTLYGAACDVISQSAGAKVNIVYGCPDPTLIEGGGPGGAFDGGFAFDADAGIEFK